MTADSAATAFPGTPIMRRLLCLLALITLSLSPSALAQSAFDTRASHAAILDY